MLPSLISFIVSLLAIISCSSQTTARRRLRRSLEDHNTRAAAILSAWNETNQAEQPSSRNTHAFHSGHTEISVTADRNVHPGECVGCLAPFDLENLVRIPNSNRLQNGPSMTKHDNLTDNSDSNSVPICLLASSPAGADPDAGRSTNLSKFPSHENDKKSNDTRNMTKQTPGILCMSCKRDGEAPCRVIQTSKLESYRTIAQSYRATPIYCADCLKSAKATKCPFCSAPRDALAPYLFRAGARENRETNLNSRNQIYIDSLSSTGVIGTPTSLGIPLEEVDIGMPLRLRDLATQARLREERSDREGCALKYGFAFVGAMVCSFFTFNSLPNKSVPNNLYYGFY